MGDFPRWANRTLEVTLAALALIGLGALFYLLAESVSPGALCHVDAGYCTWQAWLISVGSVIAAIFAPLSLLVLALTLSQMRSSTFRAQRAYVHPVACNFETKEGPKVRLVFQNFGTTPAKGLVCEYRYHFAPQIGAWSTEKAHALNAFGDVGPSQARHLLIDIPSAERDAEAAGMEGGTRILLFDGQITYFDAFGAERHTRFHNNFRGKLKDGPFFVSQGNNWSD